MLKNSERNSRLGRSVSEKCLAKPRSTCQVPGPRRRSRGAVPNSPAGVANAAGLTHSATFLPPGGGRETPGTRSGRSVPEAPCGAVELLDISTFPGKPVQARAVDVTSQLPRIAVAI